jgi:deoxyribodipyrimidine photolyase-related protein
MKTAFLVLPNQLYEQRQGPTHHYSHTYVLEEPVYFYDAKYHPYRPNKIKIAYMRACMRYYFDHCIKGAKTYVAYEDFLANPRLLHTLNKEVDFLVYDPTDHNILEKWKDLNVTYLDSPNFLFTKAQLQPYHKAHPGATRHVSFYNWSKKTLAIDELHGVKNMDSMNRQSPTPELATIPDPPRFTSHRKYYAEAIQYVNKHIFAKHLGNPTISTLTLYPITSHDAYDRFNAFLINHLPSYGPYQDAVVEDKVVLHHSFMSAALNIGLLNPSEILRLSLATKTKVPVNSFEGFLRQLIGFREYYRYLYVYKYDELIRGAQEDKKHPMTLDKYPALYTGTTGIVPFDNELQKAIQYGYSHHIVRLMIFLNLLLLHHLTAGDIYRWFTEIVSIDAYPWVMISNIYAMGYFYKGAMSRRYLSSSNYIKKMTNYEKGPWCKKWDDLYHAY